MSLSCNVKDTWDTFHYSALIFYGAYGLLCCFLYKSYCRFFYFRNKWSDNHDNDKILEYMTIGAGECCIHMSILTYFGYKFGYPDGMDSNMEDHLKAYLIIQILSWIKWTLTEFYYTYTDVEWVPLGCLHVFLCLIVLAMACVNYHEVNEKCF